MPRLTTRLTTRLSPYRIPALALAALLAIATHQASAATPPAPPSATAEAAGIKLQSMSVDLPGSDRTVPAGLGADQVTNDCSACHSVGMILTQPQLTKAEWTGEVTKMIKVYKAPVPEEDVPSIIAYLAALKIAP